MRPVVKSLDSGTYVIEDLDNRTIDLVERSLVDRSRGLHDLYSWHLNNCDSMSLDGCEAIRTEILNKYGSLEVAAQRGVYPQDCSERLSYIASEIAAAQDLLTKIRDLFRQKPEPPQWVAPSGEAKHATNQDATAILDRIE